MHHLLQLPLVGIYFLALAIVGQRAWHQVIAANRIRPTQIEAKTRRRSGQVQRADAVWFTGEVPSLLQTAIHYADRFRPGILTFTENGTLTLLEHDQIIFSVSVEGLPILYGQAGGELQVTADGQAFLIAFAQPLVGGLLPGGLVIKAMRWIRALRTAGARIQKTSMIR